MKAQLDNLNKKESKEDPRDKEIADLKAQIEKVTKEQGESKDDKTSSSEEGSKESTSALPPNGSGGGVTKESIANLPDTPENREFIIKNLDTVSRVMSS